MGNPGSPLRRWWWKLTAVPWKWVKYLFCQWDFQDPKLEVPKIWPYMVQYLHFRILKFPFILSLFCRFLLSFFFVISVLSVILFVCKILLAKYGDQLW